MENKKGGFNLLRETGGKQSVSCVERIVRIPRTTSVSFSKFFKRCTVHTFYLFFCSLSLCMSVAMITSREADRMGISYIVSFLVVVVVVLIVKRKPYSRQLLSVTG